MNAIDVIAGKFTEINRRIDDAIALVKDLEDSLNEKQIKVSVAIEHATGKLEYRRGGDRYEIFFDEKSFSALSREVKIRVVNGLPRLIEAIDAAANELKKQTDAMRFDEEWIRAWIEKTK